MRTLSATLTLLLVLALPLTAAADTNPDAVLTWHITPHLNFGQCGTALVYETPCRELVSKGQLGVGYDVYVVVGRGNVGVSFPPGIAGASFGIDYDGAAGSGLDIYSWTLCADYAFSGNGWPNPGGGTVITFDPINNCQITEVGGDGVHAVLGAFYAYAYSEDNLVFTPRTYVPNPDLKVADCDASESPLTASRTGIASFSAGAANGGYNPCCPTGDCIAPPDLTPPTLTYASGAYNGATVAVGFSERVGVGADNHNNYQVYPTAAPGSPLSVVGASVSVNVVSLIVAQPLAGNTEYTVVVSNVQDLAGNVIAPGSTVTFTTGGPDITPPTLVQAWGTPSSNQVGLLFSEDLGAGASNPANFVVTPGPGGQPSYTTVSVAGGNDTRFLTLNDVLAPGATYTVTVSNVADVVGNVIAPGSQISFVTAPGTLLGAAVALHAKPHATAGQCTTNGPGNLRCSQFTTQVPIHTAYDVYVVAVDPGASYGIAGVAFGIDYNGAAGSGVDVFTWAPCGNLEFPGQGFPASGGGNTVTWDISSNCQLQNLGDGVQAVAGWFYTYAYDGDLFSITRRNVAVPDLKIANCLVQEFNVPYPDNAGAVGFGQPGHNPCVDTPVAIEPTSWGAIKRTYGGRD